MCLAFRKTFVAAFQEKYDLESYSDIAGPIKLKDHTRLIIQVDSLPRLDMTAFPELLIVDEIESILSKLLSCHNAGMVCQNFISLIKHSGTVIAMDGLMEQRTIEYICWLRNNTIPQIVYNEFRPRENYEMLIYPYNKKLANHVVNLFREKCQAGLNIYGMITSNTLCRYIYEQLKGQFKIMCYHGDNEMYEEDASGTHQDLKDAHFKNVNAVWSQYQIVIHTSTVTAGISFDGDHFHEQINVYNSNSCDPGSFFQGSHRVRHLHGKKVTTFIEQSILNANTTPNQYLDLEVDMDKKQDLIYVVPYNELTQYIAYLKSREGCNLVYRSQVLLKYIKQMNYKVTVLSLPEGVEMGSAKHICNDAEIMAAVSYSAYESEDAVKNPRERNGYMKKHNLYIKFCNHTRKADIDEFTVEQLKRLHCERHF